MKKLASAFLILLLAFGVLTVSTGADEAGGKTYVSVAKEMSVSVAKGTEAPEYTAPEELFSDVKPGDWFYENVSAACSMGLMKGYDGYFAPEGSVTVAETLAMASRLHSLYHTGSADFVQGQPWYQVYVDYARENGILGGEELSWNSPATRRQVAVFFARALPETELAPINVIAEGAIPDVKDWYEGAREIYRLYRAGVLTGSDAYGHFQPDSIIWRSAVAAIVSRMADSSLRVSLTLQKRAYPDLPAQAPVEDSVFATSAMVGNSLAQGMMAFSGLKGMNYFTYQSTTVFNPNGADPDHCYDSLLKGKYDRVYMEYGINEINKGVLGFTEAYSALIDEIRGQMPGTEIVVMAVTPVTEKVSGEGYFTMSRIRAFNAALREMCREKDCWYLDTCEALCDETGFLPEKLAGWDGSPHLAVQGYKDWAGLIRTHLPPA